MLIVEVKGERFSPAQTAILLTLGKSPMDSRQLLKEVMKFGIGSRSTFYSALGELERRGYVLRKEEEGVLVYDLTESGRRIVSELPKSVSRAFSNILRYVSSLVKYIEPITVEEAREVEDVKFLKTYREHLERELSLVEKKLKRWKRVPID